MSISWMPPSVLRTTLRLSQGSVPWVTTARSCPVPSRFILRGNCPETSFVHTAPLCKPFQWLLTALKIKFAFHNPSHRLQVVWARYLLSPFIATPCFSSKHTYIYIFFFHSMVPCLLAVLLSGSSFILPPSFHSVLTHLFFRFWIKYRFQGNLSAPGPRWDASSPLCGTLCAPAAVWCNYITNFLEQVSQHLFYFCSTSV